MQTLLDACYKAMGVDESLLNPMSTYRLPDVPPEHEESLEVLVDEINQRLDDDDTGALTSGDRL